MSGRSFVLALEYRRRLRQFQIAHSRRLRCRVGWPELKLAMSAPFNWPTLFRAATGKPVLESTLKFIVEWLDVHCPTNRAPVFDGKAAAAGEVAHSDGD